MKASHEWGNSPNSIATRIKPNVPNGAVVRFSCTLPADKATVLLGVKGRSRLLADYLLATWDEFEKFRSDRVASAQAEDLAKP